MEAEELQYDPSRESKENVISIRESDGSIVKLEVHSSLNSTAKLAREYARLGYPDRYAVFSERQLRTVKSRGNDTQVESIGGVWRKIKNVDLN